MTTRKTIAKFIAFFTFFAITIDASNSLFAQAHNTSLSEEEKQIVVSQAAKLLEQEYVFPDAGKKMSDYIKNQLKKGKYKEIKNPTSFAQILTRDMRSVKNDRHLNVRFNPRRSSNLRVPSRTNNANKNVRPNRGVNKRARALETEKAINFYFKEVKVLDGNIGYIDFRGFSALQEASETAITAMKFIDNTEALIIDLRKNGGGSPNMIKTLSSYFFPEKDSVHLNSFYWRPTDRYTNFYTSPKIQGKRLDKIDLYILTSKRTFSAAEEFAYNLKHLKRATIVGETTGGGAHPGGNSPLNERFFLFVPKGKSINPITKTNWEGVGVKPHIEVSADMALEKAYQTALEKIIETTKSLKVKEQAEWKMIELTSKIEGKKPTPELLKSYAGVYENRKVIYKDNSLYFSRSNNPSLMKLFPLNESLFQIDGVDYFRVEFVKKGDKVTSLKGHYMDGRTDMSSKTE